MIGFWKRDLQNLLQLRQGFYTKKSVVGNSKQQNCLIFTVGFWKQIILFR